MAGTARGKEIRCDVCEREFYVRPGRISSRRFCSRTCMGIARSNQARLKRAKLQAYCSVCGALLPDRGGHKRQLKTCGLACANEAKSRAKQAEGNPRYKGDEAALIQWRTQAATCCAICGESDRLQLHHVVYEQAVRRAGGDPWDPRNSLTACIRCHAGHHHGTRGRISLELLRDENYVFAFDLLGQAAYDYLRRHYEGEDARLDALLHAVAA